MWLIDAAGIVTYVSPSVRRWLGHEPAEVVGKPLEMLCHPDEALAFVVALGRCTAATPGSSLQRLRTADGEWRKLELTLVSLRRDALAGGVLVAGRDAT